MNIYKTSDLPETTEIQSLDLLAISQDSGGSYISKKVTWENAIGNISTDIVQISGDIITNGEITATNINIDNHIGYTHTNPLRLVDAVTGLSITVYLRGGILTID